jgi:hypothetical protein
MFECFNYTTEELNNFYQYPKADGLHPTLQAVYENRGSIQLPPTVNEDALLALFITGYNLQILNHISQKFINGAMCAVRRSVIPISKRNPTLADIAQVLHDLWVNFDDTHNEKYIKLMGAFKLSDNNAPLTGAIVETMDSDTTRTPNITTSDKMTGTDTNARTGSDTTTIDDTVTDNGSEDITKTGTDTTTIDDTNSSTTNKSDVNAVTTYEDTVNFANADRLLTDETNTTDMDGTHTTTYNTTDGHTTENTTTTDGTHTTTHNTTDTLTHNTTRTVKESGSDKTALDYTKTITRGFSRAEIIDRESKIQSFVDMYLNDLLNYISLSIIY